MVSYGKSMACFNDCICIFIICSEDWARLYEEQKTSQHQRYYVDLQLIPNLGECSYCFSGKYEYKIIITLERRIDRFLLLRLIFMKLSKPNSQCEYKGLLWFTCPVILTIFMLWFMQWSWKCLKEFIA